MADALHAHASLDRLINRLEISGTLVAQTGLRIGQGRASNVVGNDLPVLRDGSGRLLIPGASLKGAFRSRVEALLRALDGSAPSFDALDAVATALSKLPSDKALKEQRFAEAVCGLRPAAAALDLEQIEDRTRHIRALQRANPNLGDELFTEVIWRTATMIDLTFGSPELAGRLFFRDAPLDDRTPVERVEVRNGVAISRDTETVEGNLLYDYEVVPAGTAFAFALTMENAADWQLGLVLLALRPWQRGEVQIGGFRSRGLGYVRLTEARARFVQVDSVDAILELLGHAPASGQPSAALTLDLERLAETPPAGDDPLATERARVQSWVEAFRAAMQTIAP